MGLHIRTLANAPDTKRDYYVYLLDYGWHEPLGEALHDNFQKMAAIANDNNAVVVKSVGDPVHFCSEVFSWHNINGQSATTTLPAIMITNRHPKEFRESYFADDSKDENRRDYKVVLFPLKKYCRTTLDVVSYIEKIFEDIVLKNDLSDFQVTKEMKRGFGKALVDGLLIEPNVAGIGYNFKSLLDYFRSR